MTLSPRTSVHKRPILSLSRPDVSSRPTVLQIQLCRRLRLSRRRLHRRTRLPSPRWNMVRRGHGGDKPPLLVLPSLTSMTAFRTLRKRRPADQPLLPSVPDGHGFLRRNQEARPRPTDPVNTVTIRPPAATTAAATKPATPLLGRQSSAAVPSVSRSEKMNPAEIDFPESIEHYTRAD